MRLPANARLHQLLEHLNDRQFAGLPRHVGLKTAIVARELGFIEWTGESPRDWKYRLTAEGAHVRKILRREARAVRR